LNLKLLEGARSGELNREDLIVTHRQTFTRALSALAASAALAISIGHALAAPAPGAAPDFTATGSDGKVHRLSDYRGSIVVLEWTNPVCGPTKRQYETGAMQKLQAKAAQQKIVWLTIDTAAPGKPGYLTAEGAKALTKARGAKISAFLFDPDGKIGRLYGAKATPSTYIVNPKGALVYQGAINGADGAYVETALAEVSVGKAVTTPFTPQRGCPVEY
jgi:hypothetical protein